MNISRKFFIYFLFVITLFVGFILNENSSGGAKIDYNFLIPFIFAFSENFIESLDLFLTNSGTLIHSPVFYIFNGYLLKITGNLLLVKFFNIFLSCLLPYIVYECLKLKYEVDNKVVFLLSLIIFLSPFFRTSAIWMLGDNLSLLFFSLSILFYLKTFNGNNKINYFLCLLFLILCCYIRYYYCLFIIFYLFNFIKNSKKNFFLRLIIFCFFCSLPAIMYLFYIIENYNFSELLSNKVSINYFNNLFIILTIIFFYIVPFIIFYIKDIYLYYKEKKLIILSTICFLIISYLINEFYGQPNLNSLYGGGVFVRLFKILNMNVLIGIYLISFISIISFIYLFKDSNFQNYFIIIILILCFPLSTIYQKYFDPLFLILFFTLIDTSILKKIILTEDYKIYFIKSYFFIFLIFSITYYL
jgi:hypothetical protein